MDAPSRTSSPPPAGRGGPFCRLSRLCAANGGASLALIIALVLVIIAMHVYYHGFLGLGPYGAAPLLAAAAARRRKKKADGPPADGDPPEGAKSDAETERLIATINSP